jgi:hypothetical protein
MFFSANNKIINSESIGWIDYKNFLRLGYVRLHYTDGESEDVESPEAFNIIMKLCPEALEGKQAKYARHVWAIHNLIGHPLMQIFSWLHLPALGIRVHDLTIPNPVKK